MNPNPSPSNTPNPPPSERRAPPVQTGSLPGGQPGTGLNTSSSAAGQSNADAAEAQGVEYGKDKLRER